MTTACRAAMVLALGLAVSPAAHAQSVRVIGDFRDWSAYATTESTGAVCFAMSKPVQTNPIPEGYTQGYLYLTNWPAEGVRHELNFIAGYTLAPDTPVIVSVGAESFSLFAQNDAAWLADAGQSENLAGVMRAGTNLTVEGTTDKGIKVVQTYSLSGATAASRAIDSDCV